MSDAMAGAHAGKKASPAGLGMIDDALAAGRRAAAPAPAGRYALPPIPRDAALRAFPRRFTAMPRPQDENEDCSDMPPIPALMLWLATDSRDALNILNTAMIISLSLIGCRHATTRPEEGSLQPTAPIICRQVLACFADVRCMRARTAGRRLSH